MSTPSPSPDTPTDQQSADWFSAEVEQLRISLEKHPDRDQSLLNASRQEMYDCLSTFFVQVRFLFSIATGIILASTAIIGFALDEGAESAPTLKITCGVIMLLLVPWRWLAIGILHPVYQLYVSSIVYSAQLHEAEGFATHWWFDYLRKYVRERPKDKDALVSKWIDDQISTYSKYKKMTDILAIAGVIGCLLLVFWAILDLI